MLIYSGRVPGQRRPSTALPSRLPGRCKRARKGQNPRRARGGRVCHGRRATAATTAASTAKAESQRTAGGERLAAAPSPA